MFPRVFSQLCSSLVRRRKPGKPVPARLRPSSSRSLAGECLETRCYLAADPIVTVNTNFGSFQIELLPGAAPQSVANFLSYVNSGAYTNSIFHRSEQPSAALPNDIGIIQAGGFSSASATYTSVSQFQTIATNSPIPLEYNLANASGTVAMARTSSPNSATDQFFINDIDNSTTLGQSNSGGYAVFGKILGNGMQIVNQIAGLSTIKGDPNNSASPFNQLPLGSNSTLARINSITLDSIDGTVFGDGNGNGQLDSGESGVAGRTVFLDINGSAQPGGTNPSTTTDASGHFVFTGIAAGSYTVREVLPSGITLTTGTQSATVAASSTAAGLLFGETLPAKITGTVFLDYNSNGQLDAGETGIAGRTVFLNEDNGGAPSTNNPSTTTDANGNFTFSGVSPGSHRVMEVLPANVSLTTPTQQTVTVVAGQTTPGASFGDRPAIIGTVFKDLNLNGQLDAGETGIPGVTVFLNVDGTGAPSSNNPTAVTNAGGTFFFEGLAPGSYPVSEVIAPFHGTTLTTTPGSVTVAAGQTATTSIGNALSSPVAPLPISVNVPAPLANANAAFVNDVYFKLLGRAADSAALSYWQQQLSGAVSRSTLVETIWNSTEHRGLQVDQFYRTFLGREAEAAGRAFWIAAYDEWGTEKIEAVGFLTSAEYSQRLHPSNADFVNALYNDVALRPADSAGLTFWQNALNNGQSRLQVAFSFLDGQESSARLVDSFYSDFLYRAPDSASQQAIIARLQHNITSIEAEAVAVLASDEYFRIASTGSR